MASLSEALVNHVTGKFEDRSNQERDPQPPNAQSAAMEGQESLKGSSDKAMAQSANASR